MSVFGRGPFRLVVDTREDQSIMKIKIVKELNGVEEDIVWLELNSETNSAQLYAANSIGIEAGAVVDITASAVQILGRKVVPSSKPIN